MGREHVTLHVHSIDGKIQTWQIIINVTTSIFEQQSAIKSNTAAIEWHLYTQGGMTQHTGACMIIGRSLCK